MACKTLCEIIQKGKNLNILLSRHDTIFDEPQQRELIYGVLRNYFCLDRDLNSYLEKKLRGKDEDIRLLLLMGIYQLDFMRIPPYAAINQTVEVCKELGKDWAKGLVNAILRRVSENEELKKESSEDLPGWFSKKLFEEFPNHHREIKRAFLNKPSMTIRINTSKISAKNYRDKLERADISYKTTEFDEAITLSKPISSEKLPGWALGEVSVQDFGAITLGRAFYSNIKQYPRIDLNILDACSAPGGKLYHLQELLEANKINGSVTALEVEKKRMSATKNIGERLQHDVALIVADATSSSWWNGEQYSHILVDAPCSSSGTIKRNPDVKILLKESQLEKNSSLQLELLRNLWTMLRPGGTLFYCTCSMFSEENDSAIERFLSENDQAVKKDFKLPEGEVTSLETKHGHQLMPFGVINDGFYVSTVFKPLN